MNFEETQKQLAVDLHSQQAGDFSRRYSSLEENGYQSCFAYSRRRLDGLLNRYLPQEGNGLRLLDVGCGTGHHMAQLRQRGFEVAGIDGSEEMLEHARANNPGSEVHKADVEKLPFADGSFDMVMSVEVLRYLPDAAHCVHEMGRVLKPGGVCLTTAAPLMNLNGYWFVNRASHLLPLGNLVRLKQFFTTSGKLRRDFISAGFAPPTIHGVYFGPINWVERLAPSLLPGLLKRWEPVDRALADRRVLREFSNMFLVHAVRK